MTISVGDLINNRYHVDAFIGKGGMADVYRVFDKGRAATLAMKILKPDLAEDRIFIRRFQREAQTLITLQHPNIVRFYDFEDQENLVFMLMDYIDGTTLRKEIFRSQGASLPSDRILQIVTPICSALNYAHEMGIIHCDIKPANIMIASTGKVLVSDFGISHLSDSTTNTMAGVGTPAYMAPEQILGNETSPATDIYALGIVLYEMLTGGERPFTGDRALVDGSTGERVIWEKLNSTPEAPSIHNSTIPSAVDEVILHCLDVIPTDRFDSTKMLLSELETALSNKPTNRKSSHKKTGDQIKPDLQSNDEHVQVDDIEPTIVERPDGSNRSKPNVTKRKRQEENRPNTLDTPVSSIPSRKVTQTDSGKPVESVVSNMDRIPEPRGMKSDTTAENDTKADPVKDPLQIRNARNLKIFGITISVLIGVILITSLTSITITRNLAFTQLTKNAQTQSVHLAATEEAMNVENAHLAQTITVQAIKALATVTPFPTEVPTQTPQPTAPAISYNPTATPGRSGCINWRDVSPADIGHTICVKGPIGKRYEVKPFYYIGFMNDTKSHFLIRKVMAHCDDNKCYLLMNNNQQLGAGERFMPFKKEQCVAFTGQIHYDNSYYFMGDTSSESCGEEGVFSSSCKITYTDAEDCE
jgi:serine/threonine protein kinase